MGLCQYKDIFGKPNEGVHSYRIFNIAIVDLLFTLIAALLISYYTTYSFIMICIILLIASLFFHTIFCVDTTLTTALLP